MDTDRLIEGTKKAFPPLESGLNDINKVVLVTEGKTKEGTGLTTMEFQIEEDWITDEGGEKKLIVFLTPDYLSRQRFFNRYGKLIIDPRTVGMPQVGDEEKKS